MKRNFLILSCSVWDVYFSCLVLESVYCNVEMGMMWHCTKVSCTSSHSIWLTTAFWCALLCCGVILCSFYQFLDKVLFHHEHYKYKVCGYDTTLFIGQQHPITVYRTGFWVCVVLVLSVICVPLANPLMKLYFIMIIILLCIISYETKFSHSFLFGLTCIFQLPGSGICTL